MPDKIHLLPDSVANQIAAGEVIQRPSSVIKELVENAIDAGADDIRIYIRDAGRTLIQVIDNGQGMSETDTRMAFERHATSKITSAADLSALRTMGFRGEALPSICAISQVEVKSKTATATIGTHLIISGSRVESQQPDVCDKGTNIMVKNLFFNVPARRKFMKSDSVELSNIMREFERLALVNPNVKMSIDTGGRTIELGKGTLLKRIGDIWKGSIVEQLIPIHADTPTVKISGFVSRPEFARRRNALQYFLVNGRNMRHAYFKKAILNCYTGLITPDSMPCFFVKFDIDPSAIDVNIHPTKDEIKFEEESVIWSILSAAVKASLGKNAAVPSIDFESDALPTLPPLSSDTEIGPPSYNIPLNYNPFASAVETSAPGRRSTVSSTCADLSRQSPSNWEKLYEGFLNPGQQNRDNADNENILPRKSSNDSPDFERTLQLAEKYIFAPIEGKGIAIIDQHRAHMKIIYESLIQRLKSLHPVSQSLLFPTSVEISPEQEAILEEASETMRNLGLTIEKVGGEYLITGVPPGVNTDTAEEIVMRIIESLADEATHYGEESIEDTGNTLKKNIALTMARSMAIKRGRALTDEERTELISDLFALPDPAFTPTGRKIYTLLDFKSIERLLH